MIRILHIDDEIDELSLLQYFFRKTATDIEIVSSDSPDRALSTALKDNYDCIVCDYNMPEMDGLELLQELRRNFGNTPFIFLSGHNDEGIIRRAMNNGADDFISKNCDMSFYDDLQKSIRKHSESKIELAS
jgi:CheY-like chemotaxis protein